MLGSQHFPILPTPYSTGLGNLPTPPTHHRISEQPNPGQPTTVAANLRQARSLLHRPSDHQHSQFAQQPVSVPAQVAELNRWLPLPSSPVGAPRIISGALGTRRNASGEVGSIGQLAVSCGAARPQFGTALRSSLTAGPSYQGSRCASPVAGSVWNLTPPQHRSCLSARQGAAVTLSAALRGCIAPLPSLPSGPPRGLPSPGNPPSPHRQRPPLPLREPKQTTPGRALPVPPPTPGPQFASEGPGAGDGRGERGTPFYTHQPRRE